MGFLPVINSRTAPSSLDVEDLFCKLNADEKSALLSGNPLNYDLTGLVAMFSAAQFSVSGILRQSRD